MPCAFFHASYGRVISQIRDNSQNKKNFRNICHIILARGINSTNQHKWPVKFNAGYWGGLEWERVQKLSQTNVWGTNFFLTH